MGRIVSILGLATAAAVAMGCGGEPAAMDGAGGAVESGGAGGAVADQGGGELGGCPATPSYFATEVVEVSYGPGQSFGRDRMPEVVLGPPLGGGCCQGSTDVVSLGNGGSIVLSFRGNAIVDGPGPDFVVFENPFETGDSVFAELATVAVSEDGESWTEFPCSAEGAPFGGCAGHTPVYLDGASGPVDPTSSGGDAFDLAQLGLAEVRYVRITDRPDLVGAAGVFDLDAVGIVHAACP